MKKNRSYSAEDIDLSEIIKTFWSEKILILLTSTNSSIGLIYALKNFLDIIFSQITIKYSSQSTDIVCNV